MADGDVDALDLGDNFPFSLEVDDLEPDGVTYAMTVIPVDDHGLGGSMPIGAQDVIRYTTPQIYPNTPVLSPERVFSVAGYDVIFSFEAPADDGDPIAADAAPVARYIPLCTFVGRGQACPDPAEAAYPTCDSLGIDFTFYDSDPKTNPDAVRYDEVTYGDVLSKNLKVMDASAIALARDNNLPIVVFSLHEPGAMTEVLFGRGRFTRVVG